MTPPKKIENKDRLLDNNISDKDQLAATSGFDRSGINFQFSSGFRIIGNRLEAIGVTSIDISAIKSNLTASAFDSFAQVLDILGGSLSVFTIFQRVAGFNKYFITTGESQITIEGLSRFYSMCCERDINHKYFCDMRSLLTHWHQLNLPGVDDEIIDFLLPIKAPKPKRPAGSRVRSDDPEEGWYTDNEYNILVSRIWSSYETNDISLYKTTLLLLSAQYGRRPIQMAHLKISDLKSVGESCGVSGRRIEFPGAKDKGSGGFREAKIEVHPMGNDLWSLCQHQASDTVNRFQAYLGRKLKITEKKLLPLFPVRDSAKGKNIHKKIETSALITTNETDMLGSFILHQSQTGVSTIIGNGPGGEPIISERTGRPLVQYAYRNRYTRVRQLARMGVPKAALQYWIGHEYTQSLDVYYDDPAERARTLNNQLAPLIAPLAQAFQGTLRNEETDAVRGDDPASRIELDGREESAVGTCGEHGFCTASVPIPCYRCTKFQPWVYGPHHEVLERLFERQQVENNIPRVGQGRRLLAPVQLDRDIEAVKTVIVLCENRKKNLEEVE